ncbi:MAG: hypothetical protein GX410_02205 [Elusimicrobia bacterium]|nr:hypothetical protein [Elusimicrobiota bacterium]
MSPLILFMASLFLSPAGAQCVSVSTQAAAQLPPQNAEQNSPRIGGMAILKGTPEPEYMWQAHNPDPFNELKDRFGSQNILDLVEYSQNALAPQAVDISGLEDKPVDLSLRLKPKQQYKGETLAAPVPPPVTSPQKALPPPKNNPKPQIVPRKNSK